MKNKLNLAVLEALLTSVNNEPIFFTSITASAKFLAL